MIDLKTEVGKAKEGVEVCRSQIEILKTENERRVNTEDFLKMRLEEMEKRLKALESTHSELQTPKEICKKLDDLEGRSKRNNLIFHGVPEEEGGAETWEDSEKTLRKVLKEEVGFSIADQVGIERAHRLGRQGNGSRPIIAQFSNFKDKEAILKRRKT